MEIIYLPQAENDLLFWIKAGKKDILKKITKITEDILKDVEINLIPLDG